MDTSLIREEWLPSVDDNIWFILDNEWKSYGVYRCVECSPKQIPARFWSATSQHWSAGHGKHIESCRVDGKGGWDKRAETGNTAQKCNGRSHPEKAESHWVSQDWGWTTGRNS